MAVYRCPVCFGKGIVARGFYDKPGYENLNESPESEKCKSCNGSGIIKA